MRHEAYRYYCPICGKPTDYNPERNGLCIDCYLKKHKLKLDNSYEAELSICVGCGKIKYGKQWLEGNADNLKFVVSRILKKTSLKAFDYEIQIPQDIDILDYRNSDALILQVQVRKNGTAIVKKLVKLKLNKAFCPLCAQKRSGKYYESVIHLRFTKTNRERVFRTIDSFIQQFLDSDGALETIDIKKDGKQGIVMRYSNKKTARRFIEQLKKRFSIAILNQYKELTEISKGTKNTRIMVEKYTIRVMS